jgi:hypothetical protein
MREGRQAFVCRTKSAVSRTKSVVRRMLGDFSDNRTQTGRQMKADRKAEKARLRAGMEEMLSGFGSSLSDAGLQGEAARLSFLSRVKETVGEQRRKVAAMRGEFASELCAARRAWLGPSAARPGVAEKPRPPIARAQKVAASRRRRPS